MFRNVTKRVCLLAMALAVTGCKIEVIVPSGGDVKSESSTRDCVGGSLCEHNVTDLTFNETFTAVARPGYVFTKWNKGHGFLCGDSVYPVCKVSLLGIPEGDTGVDALLASGHIFYVMPHFQFVGVDSDGDGIADHLDEDDDNDGILDGDDRCPLNQTPVCAPDSITVNGKVWAQPDQFLNLSIDDILAVCPVIPPGTACSGTLNGYDMTGWAWPYFQDVSALLNSYGVSPPLDGLDSRTLVNSSWAPAFFNGGWRPTAAYTDDYQWSAVTYFLNVQDGSLPPAVPIVARMYSRFGALEMTQPDIVGLWRSESVASPNVGALFIRLQ